MPYSMPDHVTQDLKRLKDTGGSRLSRIRAIVKQALSEALFEVREGSGEVRQIVTESVSTALESTQPSADTATVVPAVSQELDASAEVDVVPTDAVVLIQVDDQRETVKPTRSLVEQFLAWLQANPSVQKQYQSLKVQVGDLDQRLSDRYGDRYQTVKTQAGYQANNAKAWYQDARAKVDAGEESPGDRFQRRLETNAQVVGTSAAQTETALKQRFQDWWNTRRSSQG